MKTLVVNFFGGPGSGKSTVCADMFSRLKWAGINCEIASEFAKDLVWEEAYKTFDDQLYVFANQYHRIYRLKDKVEIILTDSPLLFGIIYDNIYSVAYQHLVFECFYKFTNLNLFLERKDVYQPEGRMQKESEAKKIDDDIKKLLDANAIFFHSEKAVEENMNNVYKIILETYKDLLKNGKN